MDNESDKPVTSYSITKEQYEKVKKDYKDKYDDLYLSILETGRLFVNDGISYEKLKTILEFQGYDFSNDCIELAVKQWFLDSFHHHAGDKSPANINELEEHLTCNFIMKGDAVLKLTGYETSKRNLKIAKIAIGIAIGIGLLQIFTTLFGQGHSTTTQIKKEQIDSLNSVLHDLKSSWNNKQSALSHQDSMAHFRYHSDSSHKK